MNNLNTKWTISLLLLLLLSIPCNSFSKRRPPPRAEDYPKTCAGDRAYCYEGAKSYAVNHHQDCVDSGQDKKWCKNEWEKNGKAIIEHCDDNYDLCTQIYGEDPHIKGSDPATYSSRMLRDKPCPPGTNPNPLGVCETILESSEETPDPYPDDGCKPGTILGPEGDCRPIFFTTFVAQFREGRFVICSSGTKPGPLGACVIDVKQIGEPEDENPQDIRSCPSGHVRGPKGECVPSFNKIGQANYFGLKVLDVLAGVELIDLREDPKAKRVLNEFGIFLSEDIERTLNLTVESLRAKPQ